jgi:enamine deaminase RidA (YjgF/YER057c/UK114 family)
MSLSLADLLARGPTASGGSRPAILAARKDDGLLTMAGQTAVRPDGTLLHHGQVGGPVSLEQARECAWLCAHNLLGAAQRHLGGLDRVAHVVRLAVYVASTPDFVYQHLVADAATEFFLQALGNRGTHARTALGVAVLPTGSPVEVDAVLRLDRS